MKTRSLNINLVVNKWHSFTHSKYVTVFLRPGVEKTTIAIEETIPATETEERQINYIVYEEVDNNKLNAALERFSYETNMDIYIKDIVTEGE